MNSPLLNTERVTPTLRSSKRRKGRRIASGVEIFGENCYIMYNLPHICVSTRRILVSQESQLLSALMLF